MLESSKFNFLVDQHKNRIFNYALYMLRNKMDAEDITQEVMIRTWQNINKFNFYAARAWIMRTTHNLCIDYLRRNQLSFRRETTIDNEDENYLEDKSNDGNPANVVNKKMIDTKIKSAIEKLPEKLKSPFVLYELEGFKYREISKILDVPLNTVKVSLLRARKYLQKELKEYKNDQFI
ncbi:MAG: RNA polymerase sigma factor [Ignavibacteriaceae bacterium]|nr:RNA polymerase sigma factor [Ignavibacteriaceae bacterium]